MKKQKQKELGLKAILHLSKEKLLKNGRANHISVCITSHHIMDGRNTRDTILYPKYGMKTKISNYLKEYEGFNKETIKELINEKSSRWFAINRHGIKYALFSDK